MAEFDYSPFDRRLRLSFVCPNCKTQNITEIGVPEPDWNSDSHSGSIMSNELSVECTKCHQDYPIIVATGISGGEGFMNDVDKVDVLPLDDDDDIDVGEKREREEEIEGLDTIVPPQDIIAFNEMRSCADLYRMYTSNQLDINPDFQRGVVWSNRAQTLFVDSVLKQLPIPSICISVDSNSQKRLVIDGLQRISTIIRFLNPESTWTLSNLEEVDSRIRGKKVSEVKEKYSTLSDLFENFVIPVTVIRCNYKRHDHMQYLFQIFHRLNSGGSKLYNQEIRNCIYQGSFNTILKSLARSESWCAFAMVTPEKVVKSRFSHEERILRFFAFNERWSYYMGRFAAFLNDYMETYVDSSPAQIENFKRLFRTTIEIALKIEMRPLARVVADAVLVGIAHNLEHLSDKPKEFINERFQELMHLDDFSTAALSYGLSQKERVKTRIKIAIEVFGRD